MQPLECSLRVNGAERALLVEPRRTLLDVLRTSLGLTGTKKVCDMGTCGACTVLVDGQATYSCLLLAVECAGSEVTTIEGLAEGDALDPLQRAFVQADAYQCGFCTPGQIMSAVALLNDNPTPTREEARHALSGNLCRCGAYDHYLNAVMRAATGERVSQA